MADTPTPTHTPTPPQTYRASITSDQEIVEANYKLASRDRSELLEGWRRDLTPVIERNAAAWQLAFLLVELAEPWGPRRWRVRMPSETELSQLLGGMARSTVSRAKTMLRMSRLARRSLAGGDWWVLFVDLDAAQAGEPAPQPKLFRDEDSDPERAQPMGRPSAQPIGRAQPMGRPSAQPVGRASPMERPSAPCIGRADSVAYKERAGAVLTDCLTDDDDSQTSVGENQQIELVLDEAGLGSPATRAQVCAVTGITAEAVAWCLAEARSRKLPPARVPGLTAKLALDGDWREPLADRQAAAARADADLAQRREQAALEHATLQRDQQHREHATAALAALTADQLAALHRAVLERAQGVQRKSWTTADWRQRWPLALAMHEAAVGRGWCEDFDCSEALAEAEELPGELPGAGEVAR